MKFLIPALALMTVASSAFGQTITPYKVTDTIYMLEGRGGNIGVSTGEDGILIIDTQYANMADPIRDAIRDMKNGEVKFIINTHFHGDHTGGNRALGQGVPIIAQENVWKRMSRGKDLGNTEFRNSLPVITYADTASLHFNGEEIKLVHFPNGHTDTDSVAFFTESNVVHMGDHFFVDRFPYIDLASGGDVAQYIENVGAILELLPDDVKIIPGHGPLATKQDLKDFRAMLVEVTDIIRKEMKTGISKRDLQKSDILKDYEKHGQGFVKTKMWIGIVYDSFSR